MTTSLVSSPLWFPIFCCLSVDARLAAEHIFERQAVINFIKSTITGTLASGATSAFGAIEPSFWETTVKVPLTNIPTIGSGEVAPIRRMMTRLGAVDYRKVFVLADEVLNTAKASIWGYDDPTVAEKMRHLLATDMTEFLNKIRFVSTIKQL